MLINPQIDRSKTSAQQEEPFLHLGRVGETSDGIIVRGAKMLGTMAPITEEVAVIPFGGVPPGGRHLCAGLRYPDAHTRPQIHLPRDGGPATAVAL
jgi:4-hydroxyphenylacetate 3-hydroxylase N terminal